MTWHDRLSIALGNLWRMKLRAFLTISGVVIAIAAFVAMLSFGAGNQKLVAEQFERLGLLSTIIVYPGSSDEAGSDTAAVLNDDMVDKLSRIPGVNLAYPMEAFSVEADLADTQIATRAQALPEAAPRRCRRRRCKPGWSRRWSAARPSATIPPRRLWSPRSSSTCSVSRHPTRF